MEDPAGVAAEDSTQRGQSPSGAVSGMALRQRGQIAMEVLIHPTTGALPGGGYRECVGGRCLSRVGGWERCLIPLPYFTFGNAKRIVRLHD